MKHVSKETCFYTRHLTRVSSDETRFKIWDRHTSCHKCLHNTHVSCFPWNISRRIKTCCRPKHVLYYTQKSVKHVLNTTCVTQDTWNMSHATKHVFKSGTDTCVHLKRKTRVHFFLCSFSSIHLACHHAAYEFNW